MFYIADTCPGGRNVRLAAGDDGEGTHQGGAAAGRGGGGRRCLHHQRNPLPAHSCCQEKKPGCWGTTRGGWPWTPFGGSTGHLPSQPGPTSDGCPQALVRCSLGPDPASVLCPQVGERSGAPFSTPSTCSASPWWIPKTHHPSGAGSHPGYYHQSVGGASGAWAWCQPHPGDSQTCSWQVCWVPPSGPHHSKTTAPDTCSPTLCLPSSQGAAADLALPAPSDTGLATPEALEERLLSEVPLERQSGQWHTQCTRPMVVWAPTDSQFQEAHKLLAAVGRWHVPAWDYVHDPGHPKWADKAKSMRFPCPQPGCPKVLSKYLDLKGHFQCEHIGGRTAPLCDCPSGAFNSASVFADHLDMIHNVQWVGVARGSRRLWRCYRDRKYASPSAPASKRMWFQ